MVLVKDKSFYKQLLTIAFPIAAQNLVNFGVSMADTVMLGMLGDVQLAASTNANQLGFIFMLLTFGVGSGSNVIIAQYWGKGEKEPIYRIMTVMYRILLVAGLLFSVVAIFFPRAFMSIFTTDGRVIAEGVQYLRIIGYSYLLTGITSGTVFVLRAVASVNIALSVYLSSLVVNVALNYCLIFGNFGFPAMGIQGAAIATCIARVVELVILLVYMAKFEKRIRFQIKYLFLRKLGVAREFVSMAIPVIINEVLWGSGSAMIVVIVGRMGTEFTAANSICTVLSQLVTISIFGVGNASAVIVGNTVGSGRYDLVRQYASTFSLLSLGLGLFSSCVVFLLKGPLLSIYNISDLARLYAAQIMSLYTVVVIFQSVAAIQLIGVLRGAGDTRFVLLADVAFMWCISIPCAMLAGWHLGWPVWAVYGIIKFDEVLKTISSSWRISRGAWIKDVTTKNVTKI